MTETPAQKAAKEIASLALRGLPINDWDSTRHQQFTLDICAIIERHQQPNVDDFIAKLKEYLKNPDDTLFVKMGNISWVIHEFEKCLKK